MYSLGRIYVPDGRDLMHPMTRHLYSAPKPRTEPWALGPILDQGDKPECTAFAWRSWKNAEPDPEDPAALPSNDDFYSQEQAIDGIPGPHEGSTVRAGAKLIQQEGLLGEYVWASTVDEMAAWLVSYSPIVLGLNWYSGMDSPTPDGIVNVDGAIRGGHAFMAYWYEAPTQLFWCQNSWGLGFGKQGLFAIPRAGMARLLSENGEACGVVKPEPVAPVKKSRPTCPGLVRFLRRAARAH